MFFDDYNRMPNNYAAYTVCDVGPSENFYNQSMQELVDAGFLSTIPRSPDGSGYCFYNYGPGNNIGVLMRAMLETYPPSTTGVPPSCRPFSWIGNWCSSAQVTKEYCICNPH